MYRDVPAQQGLTLDAEEKSFRVFSMGFKTNNPFPPSLPSWVVLDCDFALIHMYR